jgi:hypothetical protein
LGFLLFPIIYIMVLVMPFLQDLNADIECEFLLF